MPKGPIILTWLLTAEMELTPPSAITHFRQFQAVVKGFWGISA